MSSKIVRYKCPFCEKRLTREDLIIHIDDNHEDMLPQNYSSTRYVFNYVNKKPVDYSGKCTECGGPTKWREDVARYDRQCDKPSCRQSYLKKFENNMVRTKGVSRISLTPEGQEKMLANRKISGTYKFQNGKEKTYTGSYELKALEFMDKVMNINPDDILCPGPILEYEYEGKKHFYITDFYYIPYNLIIEVKDGGKNPNKRNMPEYREKQIAKEKYIIKNTDYAYLRLTDNDLSQLLSVFMDLKMQLKDNTGKRVIQVNEAMNALMTGYIPGFNDTGCVYIVNYMQNNVFSGDQERGYGVSNTPKLTSMFSRNKEGRLVQFPDNFLENCRYDVYMVKMTPEEVSNRIGKYVGEFVEEGLLYESIFGKKMYTYDQIMTEESAIPVIDFYKGLEMFGEVTKNFILQNTKMTENPVYFNENSIMTFDIGTDTDTSCVSYATLRDGKTYVESVQFPELYLEADSINSVEAKFLQLISLYRKEVK